MEKTAIVGVGMHDMGRFEKPLEKIGVAAVEEALNDAAIEFSEVDEAFCGNVFGPESIGHRTLAKIGRTGVPITNVENACAVGGNVIRLGSQTIATGRNDIVLVFGLEKMPRGFIEMTGYEEWRKKEGHAVNPLYWALEIRRHMHDYGTTQEQLGLIAEKNHRNSTNNPHAMYQEEFSTEEILSSKTVCDPLTLLMTCAPCDGSAAAILCREDMAEEFTDDAVTVEASTLASAKYGVTFNRLRQASHTAKFEDPNEAEVAARKAYEEASLSPEDIDIAEVQDTSAANELLAYEELGFCDRGEGGNFIAEGKFDYGGEVVVNPSGGLISKGEALGASGLVQCSEIVWQLRREAGDRQVEDAEIGISHTLGDGGNCAMNILKKAQ